VAGERVKALSLLPLVLLALALGADLALAHPSDYPHEEPTSSEADSTSSLLIVAGVVVTLALVGGLVWLKERARRAEAEDVEEQMAAEPGADAGQRLST
jgi:hypothetical protein